MLCLKTGNRKKFIIQAYAPTSQSTEEECEHILTSLEETIIKIRKSFSYYLMIMGDWKSHVGRRNQEEHSIIGPYGFGRRNQRGWKLVRFYQQHRLKIVNSFYKKCEGRKWTCISPGEQIKT